MADSWGGSWGTPSAWGSSWGEAAAEKAAGNYSVLGPGAYPRPPYASFVGKAAADAAVTGGYTPYSVYDPGQERRIRTRRKTLRREREKLRADLALLVSGKPAEVPEPQIEAVSQSKPKIAPSAAPEPVRDRAAANAEALQVAAVSARRARLEVIGNELLALEVDLRAVRERLAEDRRLARENELLIILLMAS